jgi:predicted nuclease of predicted toxin-antitoxin system
VRILPDENLPRKLVAALRAEGHEVESVHTLRMQGLDNGKLYEFAVANFDVCFTRDFGFANNVRQGQAPAKFKLFRVTLSQKLQDEFVLDFISAFRANGVERYQHGDDWP